MKKFITNLKSLWDFIFHFNPAQDIEWEGGTYNDEIDEAMKQREINHK